MLGKFIIINNNVMPNPEAGSFVWRINADENVYDSEAGYQLSNVKRLDRVSWSATFDCTGSMKDRIIAFCKLASVTCKIANTSYSGRLRLSGDCTLVANSEWVRGTDGLWQVPVIFEEF